jgi:hypothetical protein
MLELIRNKPNRFEYDPELHLYLVDGVEYSHVTEILRKTGITPEMPLSCDLDRWYGTAVHKAIELYVKGELDWNELDPRLLPHVQAYQDFERDTGFKSHSSEIHLYSTIGNVAGRLDLAGKFPDGRCGIVDTKSGAVSNWVAIQTAAYAWLMNPWEQFNQQSAARRFGLSLMNGKPKIKEFSEQADYHVWFSAVSIYNWKKNHGG